MIMDLHLRQKPCEPLSQVNDGIRQQQSRRQNNPIRMMMSLCRLGVSSNCLMILLQELLVIFVGHLDLIGWRITVHIGSAMIY